LSEVRGWWLADGKARLIVGCGLPVICRHWLVNRHHAPNL
jgi:hypothetical protein